MRLALVFAASTGAAALQCCGGRAQCAPPSRAGAASRVTMSSCDAEPEVLPPLADASGRRAVLARGAATASAAALASALSAGAPLPANAFFDDAPVAWDVVSLPFADPAASPILFDIEFDTKDPNLGWIVGNRGTFLQTADGGKTWTAKSFANLDPDEEINYRFTKVSFKDGEGWIIGKPAILLHTRDGGSSWERVPLSPKLPGDPYGIVALGPGKAEMSTSAGAIYVTDNAGRNWKAQVRAREAVHA